MRAAILRTIILAAPSAIGACLLACAPSHRPESTRSSTGVIPASTGLAVAVDAYMEPLVRSHDFAGAVLVARGDRILFERGYGLANAELGVPNTPTTVFRIASVTKTFTAAAIVMLAERGVIHYGDSLGTYLPGYPNGGRITIRHLLLHASGVANPPYDQIVTRRLTLPRLIDQFRDKPLLFAPGTESRYSNAGYVLLAAVIERASGMSYEEFIRRNITEPLGLTSTLPDPQEGLVLQRASGYVPGPPPLGVENVAWYDMSPFAGSGILLSTVRDLHRWARAVHREQLYRRTALEYPYGWGVRKYFGRDLIEQSGTIDGFTSYLGVYFADSTYVICLTNVEGSLNERCGKDVAAMVFGARVEPVPAAPAPRVGLTIAAADTGRLTAPGVGTFSLSLQNGLPFVKWVTARTAHYATPVGTDSLFVHADRSLIVLDRDASGRLQGASRSWAGGSPVRFTPQPPP